MSKRYASPLAMVSALVVAGALAFAGGASGAGSLPTLTVTVKGTKSVSVSGDTVSGAVNVVGSGHGQFALFRLNPGVSIQQAAAAVPSHHGDLNALTPYGSLFVDAGAPGTVQTVLTPGNYVALNVTGNSPAFAPFTVTQSSSPATLPAAAATETSIEFGFKGPKVLHNGTVVRAVNGGWLVHMIDLIGVRNLATAHKAMALLRTGKDSRAQRLVSGPFVTLIGPASPGGLQQQVLHTKPGLYIEACFMSTGDGREHTQLGMMRLVRVRK